MQRARRAGGHHQPRSQIDELRRPHRVNEWRRDRRDQSRPMRRLLDGNPWGVDEQKDGAITRASQQAKPLRITHSLYQYGRTMRLARRRRRPALLDSLRLQKGRQPHDLGGAFLQTRAWTKELTTQAKPGLSDRFHGPTGAGPPQPRANAMPAEPTSPFPAAARTERSHERQGRRPRSGFADSRSPGAV